jgi:thiamine biosynthesis lipoprotein
MNKHIKISRRQFFKIIAASSVAGLTYKLGGNPFKSDEIISESRVLMGTIINLTLVSADPRAARTAIQACLDRMTELESVLSRYQVNSQLSRLNQTGAITEAHPALLETMQQSLKLSQLTGGAFDITVKPLLELYQSTKTGIPAEEKIEQALRLVNYQNIAIKGNQIAFRLPGMSVTLDGIAKGFIVDEGVSVLKRLGFDHVMVEAGGDLMASGEIAPDSPRKIGIQNPRAGVGELMTTFTVRDRAVATSGDYMQAFTSDFMDHHILDPRKGRSSPELASASVSAPSAALADGLATAVMVMGHAGLELIEALHGCEAFVITKDLKIKRTTGF